MHDDLASSTPARPTLLRSLTLLAAALVCALVLVAGCADTATDEASETGADTTVAEGVLDPAWVEDVVMYEIFVPDFSPEGTFQGVINRLDTLQAMGVNTLWLMPIHPIGEEKAKTDIGPLGSPYAVRDFYGVNEDYGGEEGFRTLVDSVHGRGMYIIIDLVANHTAWDNPWLDEHPDWYTEGPIDGFTVPILDGDTTDWTDVVELNFDNEEMRQGMIDVMQYWVEEFDIDGYRCDVAHSIPLDFWQAAIDSVETIKPVLMLAEAAEPEMHEAGFDMTYAWPFYGVLKRVWEEGAPVSELATQVDTTLQQLNGGLRLRFTTNHDESAWDASPIEIFGGEEGSEAAFVLATTMPGAPLVYNGQELGIEDTVSFFAATPYNWSQEETMLPFYDDYLSFYSTSTALTGGAYEMLTPDATDALVYTRSADGETLVITVNVRDQATTVTMPEAYSGQSMTDVLSGESVQGGNMELEPYGYRILRVGQSPS